METVSVDIDLAALKHNMAVIKKMVPDSRIIAVVKANAYGHGSVACACAMDEFAFGYAVARLEEACELREAGITKPIVMLGGCACVGDLEDVARLDISVTVHSFEMLEELKSFCRANPGILLSVWCQVNIGMQRLGFNEDEIAKAMEDIRNFSGFRHPVGMMAHLSCSDEAVLKDYHLKQLAAFNRMSRHAEGALCLANSAGIIYYPDTHTEFVRPGIIQYGISPSSGRIGADFGLQAVMTMRTVVYAVRELCQGDAVGYGASWVADRPTRIAVLGAGYADGYPRSMPNGSPVYLNGTVVHTVGHVCMDMMFVDIGMDLRVSPGDVAELWGRHIPVEKVAELTGTIPYELVTRPTRRVRYRYLPA
ncbi:alanine racemase [Succinimonas amylolytica]|uniref:alanine racemase n=1 Tax=Succinimonas amylolytica TaxID=83769 RepID=UPI00036E4372|nr:alanine racemase [Succinimonas amylolytica]